MDSYEVNKEQFFPVDLNQAQFNALRLYFSGEMDVFDYPMIEEKPDTPSPTLDEWLPSQTVRFAVGRGGPDGKNALLVNGLFLHSDGEFATFPESQMPVDNSQ